jgi:hypothetical protein
LVRAAVSTTITEHLPRNWAMLLLAREDYAVVHHLCVRHLPLLPMLKTTFEVFSMLKTTPPSFQHFRTRAACFILQKRKSPEDESELLWMLFSGIVGLPTHILA